MGKNHASSRYRPQGQDDDPRKTGLRGHRATIIPADSFPVIAPIISDPYKAAGSLPDTERDAKTLKKTADRKATKDATERPRRY